MLGSVYAAQAIGEAIRQVVAGTSTQPLLAQEGEGRRKIWQASIWTGAGPDELVETVVYGESLPAVREAALSVLKEQGPVCLSNARNRWSVPHALWAEYSQRKSIEQVSSIEQGESEVEQPHESEPSSRDSMKRKRLRRSRRVPTSKPASEQEGEQPISEKKGDEPVKSPTLDLVCAATSKPPPAPAGWHRTGPIHDAYTMFLFERAEQAYSVNPNIKLVEQYNYSG